MVGEVFLEEVVFRGRVGAEGALGALAGGKAMMRLATTEAATEGAGKLAAVLRVGVGVDWVVGIRGGRGSGTGGGVVVAEDRLGRADENGRRGRRRGFRGLRMAGRRESGDHGGDLAVTHVANGGKLLPDFLGCGSKATEFGELEMECSKVGVVSEEELVLAFLEAGLDVMGEVDEELLSKGARPGSNGSGGGGIQSGDDGLERVKELGRGVISLLFCRSIKAGGGELTKLPEDGLGGLLVADVGPDVIGAEEVAEAGEVAAPKDIRESGVKVDAREGGSARLRGGGGRVDSGNGGPEFSGEQDGVVEEGKRAVVVGKGAGVGEDTGTHGGWDARRGDGIGWGLGIVGCRGGGIVRVGGVRDGRVQVTWGDVGSGGRVARSWRAGKTKEEVSGEWAKGGQAGVEGSRRRDGGGDADKGKALVKVGSGFFAGGDGKDSFNSVAASVEEAGGVVSNGSMAGLSEGGAEGVAELGTFRVDGVKIEGKFS